MRIISSTRHTSKLCTIALYYWKKVPGLGMKSLKFFNIWSQTISHCSHLNFSGKPISSATCQVCIISMGYCKPLIRNLLEAVLYQHLGKYYPFPVFAEDLLTIGNRWSLLKHNSCLMKVTKVNFSEVASELELLF